MRPKAVLGTVRKALAVGSVGLIAAASVAFFAGLYINTTVSIPRGVYRVATHQLQLGALVVACPPPAPAFLEAHHRGYIAAGFCPGGLMPLMKRVLAAKGDRVVITDQGVFVNGHHVPHSAQMRTDNKGRLLPAFRFDRDLHAGEVLLMGEASRVSFDGRYFGPIPAAQIKAVISPLLTW